MTKKQATIDGFSPRRKTETPKVKSVEKTKNSKKQTVKTSKQADGNLIGRRLKSNYSDENSIEEALLNLDIDSDLSEVERQPSRRDRRLDEYNKKRSRKNKKLLSLRQFRLRRAIRSLLALILIVGVGFLVWRGYKTFNDISKSFNGNLFDIIKKEKLKEDSDGRTNILIFGTSPKGWDGEDLTDSVIIVSANQTTKTAKTISLPRDLWVKHSCADWLGTTAGKLNETYGCAKKARGLTDDQAEAAGQDALAKTAGKILGLDIHYKIHANWQVLIDVIDKLGGIDITVEVWDGSPEMYDAATKVRYKNGQKVHMNGQQALAFSRARGSYGGYGLSGGNFDRERNQQKIIQATVQKINQSKFNPVALIGIATALGDNVKTSFQPSEIQTAAEVAQNFSGGNIQSLPLIDEQKGINLMTVGMINGTSVVLPTAGTYDYQAIHQYIQKNTKSSPEVEESAKIVVLNGTKINGLAAETKNRLTKDGFEVVKIDSAKNQNYKTNKLYDVSKKAPKTLAKIAAKYSAEIETLPDDLRNTADGADILLIMGEK